MLFKMQRILPYNHLRHLAKLGTDSVKVIILSTAIVVANLVCK